MFLFGGGGGLIKSWKYEYLAVWYSENLKYYDHLKSGNIKNPDFLKVGFQMVQFSNGRAFSHGYSYSPNHLITGLFENRMFLSGFQMVSDKMGAICLDSKWLGFRISDPIWNRDHLQLNLFLAI